MDIRKFFGGGAKKQPTPALVKPAKDAASTPGPAAESPVASPLPSPAAALEKEVKPMEVEQPAPVDEEEEDAPRKGTKRRKAISSSSEDEDEDAEDTKPAEAPAPAKKKAGGSMHPMFARKAASTKSPGKKAARVVKKEEGGEKEDAKETLAVPAAGAEVKAEVTAEVKAEPKAATRAAPAAAAVPLALGKPVLYKQLADCLDSIGSTTKRLEITERLCNFIREVLKNSPDQLLNCIFLCINKLGPDHANIELGVGDSLLMKALAQSTGRTAAKIKAAYQKEGDLGVIAMSARGGQKTLSFGAKPKPLYVDDVFGFLTDIANASGRASSGRRVGIIQKMLVRASGCEPMYIIRSCQGKLRIGLAEKTLLVGLSRAFALTPVGPDGLGVDRKFRSNGERTQVLEKARACMVACFGELPDYGVVLPALIKCGGDWVENLHKLCHLTPGVPIHPMLAKPTKGIVEVLDRFKDKEFTCEYKYDGERAQVHLLEDGSVRIFSRNSLDDTTKFPEIVNHFGQVVVPGVTSMVIDSECVAWDPVTKKILPFQMLSTRSKKNVKEEDVKDQVKVCLFAFDLLYLNGKSLVKTTFRERRTKMHASLVETPGMLKFADYADLKDTEEMQDYLEKSIKDNCEGLMVKTLDGADSTYEPSNRSQNWLKVKKDYVDGLTDSFDLVPIGAFYGKGKRTGFYGGYLLACYDEDSEQYQSICKIGTGFSDENLKKLTDELKPHAIDAPKPFYRVATQGEQPDVWLDAVQVWEVMAADLSISPRHFAAVGLADPAKGISLRFPRFLRVREDKGPEDGTNAVQICEMYQNQAVIGGGSGSKGLSNIRADAFDDDDDEY